MSDSQIAGIILASTPDPGVCPGIDLFVASDHVGAKLPSQAVLLQLHAAINEKSSSVAFFSRFKRTLVNVSIYQTLFGPTNAYSTGRIWRHPAMQAVINRFNIAPLTEKDSYDLKFAHHVLKAAVIFLNGQYGVDLWSSEYPLGSGKCFPEWNQTNANTQTHLYRVKTFPPTDKQVEYKKILAAAPKRASRDSASSSGGGTSGFSGATPSGIGNPAFSSSSSSASSSSSSSSSASSSLTPSDNLVLRNTTGSAVYAEAAAEQSIVPRDGGGGMVHSQLYWVLNTNGFRIVDLQLGEFGGMDCMQLTLQSSPELMLESTYDEAFRLLETLQEEERQSLGLCDDGAVNAAIAAFAPTVARFSSFVPKTESHVLVRVHPNYRRLQNPSFMVRRLGAVAAIRVSGVMQESTPTSQSNGDAMALRVKRQLLESAKAHLDRVKSSTLPAASAMPTSSPSTSTNLNFQSPSLGHATVPIVEEHPAASSATAPVLPPRSLAPSSYLQLTPTTSVQQPAPPAGANAPSDARTSVAQAARSSERSGRQQLVSYDLNEEAGGSVSFGAFGATPTIAADRRVESRRLAESNSRNESVIGTVAAVGASIRDQAAAAARDRAFLLAQKQAAAELRVTAEASSSTAANTTAPKKRAASASVAAGAAVDNDESHSKAAKASTSSSAAASVARNHVQLSVPIGNRTVQLSIGAKPKFVFDHCRGNKATKCAICIKPLTSKSVGCDETRTFYSTSISALFQ